MFKVTFYSKVVKNGKTTKYILVTSKDDNKNFIKLQEGSKFGLFTITKIENNFIEYTVSKLKGTFIKPYSIISSKKDK
jgi:acyl CoA:acetate/3-ketoacid CoA transferase alpha subunit